MLLFLGPINPGKRRPANTKDTFSAHSPEFVGVLPPFPTPPQQQRSRRPLPDSSTGPSAGERARTAVRTGAAWVSSGTPRRRQLRPSENNPAEDLASPPAAPPARRLTAPAARPPPNGAGAASKTTTPARRRGGARMCAAAAQARGRAARCCGGGERWCKRRARPSRVTADRVPQRPPLRPSPAPRRSAPGRSHVGRRGETRRPPLSGGAGLEACAAAGAAAMWETGPEACAGQRARPPPRGRAGASVLGRAAVHGSRGPAGRHRPLPCWPPSLSEGGRGRLSVRWAEAGPGRAGSGAGACPGSLPGLCALRGPACPATVVWLRVSWEGLKLARSSPRSAGARLWQREGRGGRQIVPATLSPSRFVRF